MQVRKANASDVRITESWDNWSREPSEFVWYYEDNESCYIMEGEATVTDRLGNSISFGPGDWVEFEKGLHCNWRITKKISKKYMLH